MAKNTRQSRIIVALSAVESAVVDVEVTDLAVVTVSTVVAVEVTDLAVVTVSTVAAVEAIGHAARVAEEAAARVVAEAEAARMAVVLGQVLPELKTKISTRQFLMNTEPSAERVDTTSTQVATVLVTLNITSLARLVRKLIRSTVTLEREPERRISRRAVMARATGAMRRSQSLRCPRVKRLARRPKNSPAEKDARRSQSLSLS
jgi:transcriptional regulator of aromatic amino acid metabolism